MPVYNEYLTSNMSIAYPFADDSLGLAADGNAEHGAVAKLPLDFFIDAVMTGPKPDSGTYYLKSIERLGAEYTFIFADDNGDSVITNAKDFSTFPDERSIITFVTSTADPNDTFIMRALVGPGFESFLDGMADPSTDTFDDRLPLSSAVIEYRPPRVSALRIDDKDIGIVDLTEEVGLVEGYNCSLSTSESIFATPPRGGGQITITLSPGLGEGLYNECDEEGPIEYIARINALRGDSDGNFVLAPDACHNIIPDPDNNRIFIENICIPCCDCDDFVNVIGKEREYLLDLRDARNLINSIVVLLNEHITAYNEAATRRSELEISIYGSVGYPLATSESTMSYTYCSIVIDLTNRGNNPISGLNLDFSFNPDDFDLVTGWVHHNHTTIQVSSLAEASAAVATMRENSMSQILLTLKRPFPRQGHGTLNITATYTVEGQPHTKYGEGTW